MKAADGDALRLALVGAGAIGQSWLGAIGDLRDDVVLTAVVEPNGDAARAAAAPAGAAMFDSVGDLQDAGVEIDAAIVCCPPAAHLPAAIALLDDGISVLCEKPLTIDVPSARKLIAAAEAGDALLTMASKFRYVDALRQAREMVQAGDIGDVLWYRNTFAATVDMRDRWNSDPAIAGGGVIIDNGTHSVDVCRYVLGPINRVQAVEGRRWQELPVEDTATLLLGTESGATATIELSWSLSVRRPTYIEIDGTLGSVAVGWQESFHRGAGDDDWTPFAGPYDKRDAFRRNLADFAGAVRGEHTSLVSCADVFASVAVVDAAYRSLGDGWWVDVEKP
jgi:predicted dehydrogenase